MYDCGGCYGKKGEKMIANEVDLMLILENTTFSVFPFRLGKTPIFLPLINLIVPRWEFKWFPILKYERSKTMCGNSKKTFKIKRLQIPLL